jgi:hypothetical protein
MKPKWVRGEKKQPILLIIKPRSMYPFAPLGGSIKDCKNGLTAEVIEQGLDELAALVTS